MKRTRYVGKTNTNAVALICTLIVLSGAYFLSAASKSSNEDLTPYVSQNFIDTIVQNAYYNFIAASEVPDDGSHQIAAIDHAKKVVHELKKIAKNDPNRRYILWRVGELEHQIYLETQEVEMKHSYKHQKEINKLVVEFNGDIGKWRPNFTNLYVILERMNNLDDRKATELETIIYRRNKNISREVCYFLDEALKSGKYDKAEKEFNYIRENRKYLCIPSYKYDEFENRIHAKIEADDMVDNLSSYTSNIQRKISSMNLKEARFGLTSLQLRLKQIKPYLSVSKYSVMSTAVTECSQLLSNKEDSLIQIGTALINQQNLDEAIDYFENVLIKNGVSQYKLVALDKAIMRSPSRYESASSKQVNQELTDWENYPEANKKLSYDAFQTRVNQKMDSLHALLATNEPSPLMSNQGSFRENNDLLRQNQEKARMFAENIYIMLDKNSIEKAYENFMRVRDMMRKYSSIEVFNSLEQAVMKAYQNFSRKE